MRRLFACWLWVVSVSWLGCSSPGGADAGHDGGPAAPLDAGTSAPDGGSDGGLDGGACGTSTPAGLRACVEVARYRADLELVTGVRTPGNTHWQEVQDLCAQRLSSLGFTVERHQYATGVNVVGVLPGGDLGAQQVVVSAHYDHIANCPGADDNASGVAGALETARVLAQGRYRRTLVVACWDEEEAGLIGSRAWAARAKGRAENIATAFVFEMIGYRNTDAGTQSLPAGLEFLFPAQTAAVHQNQDRGDFVALIGDDLAHASLTRFETHARALGLPTIVLELTAAQKGLAAVGELRRSDHSAFWQQDYAALMLGDTANFRNANYHCGAGPDVTAGLDHAFAAQIIGATIGSVAELLETR